MYVYIAAVQFNPIVGAIRNNSDRIFAAYEEAAKQGADIVVFPECSLPGYPLEDLVLRESFLIEVTLETDTLNQRILQSGYDAACIYGTVSNDSGIHNTSAFVDPQKQSVQYRHKQELPNYGVFDEKRTFISGDVNTPITWRGYDIGLMICEDAWFPKVTEQLKDSDLIISINGSPFEAGKIHKRKDVIRQRLIELCNHNLGVSVPILYVNMVGGQDELVFDGGSFFLGMAGEYSFPQFKEGIFYVRHRMENSDLSAHHNDSIGQLDGISEIYRACVLGLRDYVGKQGFESVVLGMSGGVDSGLVAALAVDAIGPKNVHLVRLPSEYSSQGSLKDAKTAAIVLGANLRTIHITPIVEALRKAYTTALYIDDIDNTDDCARYKFDKKLLGVADENIQARARGNILMAISNQEGQLLLSTGNKSEMSTGYGTLYGDMSGGFNPIKDCYKTTVWDMCRWRNSLTLEQLSEYSFLGPVAEVVPESIISKPPSAELRPDQKDEDSLPPYPILDAILYAMIEQEKSVKELEQEGFTLDILIKVRNLVDRSEYKRRQACPGVKITSKIYGRDRRYPIVNRWRS